MSHQSTSKKLDAAISEWLRLQYQPLEAGDPSACVTQIHEVIIRARHSQEEV